MPRILSKCSFKKCSLNSSLYLKKYYFGSDYSSERWYTAQKECKAEDQYGFPDNPCIFVKVNRVGGGIQ